MAMNAPGRHRMWRNRPHGCLFGQHVDSFSVPPDPMGAMAGFESPDLRFLPMGAMAGFELSVSGSDPMGAMAGFEPLASSSVVRG